MTRAALAAAVLLAPGCASTASPGAAHPAAYTVEVRFERSGGEPVVAPRLFTFAGQRSTVQVLRQESYVQSFELDRGSAVVDPVVGTVQGGILLEARTLPLAGGGGARFEYRATVLEPRKPFGERKVPLAGGTEFTLQLPEVERCEVEGAACLPDGEERAVAVLPWAGEGGGEVTVRVRVHGAGMPGDAEPFGGEGLPEGGIAEAAPPAPAAPVAAGRPGWFRLRSVRLARAMEQGTVLEGAALRALREGGGLAVERDLQWAGTGEEVPHAKVTVERPLLTDFETGPGTEGERGFGPVLQAFTSGLLADPDPAGGLRCTSASLLPVKTFTTDIGTGAPVTIDLPEIRVHAATVGAGAGERLLVLGAREGGGSDGVLLSFRPGATGPEE